MIYYKGKSQGVCTSAYDLAKAGGFSGTDAEFETSLANLSNKADKSTTLSGYGITDAYTKTQIDSAVNNKADKSTTYTKTEADNLLAKKAGKITWSTITIASTAWNSSSKTATVSVSGVTTSNAVDVAPAEASYDAYVSAGIRASAQGSGTLTFKCKTVPTAAISVNIKTYSN